MNDQNANSPKKKGIYKKTSNKFNKSQRWIIYAFGIVFIGGIFLVFFPISKTSKQDLQQKTSLSPTPLPMVAAKKITIGKTKLKVEIVRQPEELEKGLSGRKSLAEDEGMLFVFATPGRYGFWMKEMRFPIDIIWIVDGKVAGFEENLPVQKPNTPDSALPAYQPTQPITAALEVNAGFIEEKNIQVGDPVEFADLEPSI